jgi:enoyl-CoA hydratase/carnithine racemase
MNAPKHFLWRLEGKVGVITLNRPEKKNPLTSRSLSRARKRASGT